MKHAAIAVALALAISVGPGEPASAQDITELAKEAEAARKDGKTLQAYETMRQALLQVWQSSPLMFRKAVFAKKAPRGFGIYDPRPDGPFKPGEKLFIYVEPVGFAWKEKDGLSHAELVADLVLKDDEGAVLGEQKGFGTFTFDSRDKNMEVMTALTIDFSDAPAGQYVAELKFTDTFGKTSATLELPFEIKDADEASAAPQ